MDSERPQSVMKYPRHKLIKIAVLLVFLVGVGYVGWRGYASMRAAAIIDEHFDLVGGYFPGYNVAEKVDGRYIVHQQYRSEQGTSFTVIRYPSEFIVSWIDMEWALKLTGGKIEALSVVSDQELGWVKAAFDLQGLTRLESYSDEFTGAELAGLPSRDIVHLQLSNTGLTDAGLEWIGDCEQLQFLDLEATSITDTGLSHLEDLQQLEHLRLSKTDIGDEGVHRLLPLTTDGALRYLYLDQTEVTDGAIDTLRKMQGLEELGLAETEVTDAAVDQLIQMKSLKFLRLRDTRVSETGMDRLRNALPDCRIW
ncbi:MAG: hypothetical protein CMJ46_03475 [Planctomyces sp.]|nr:hypothetical protein [Planctomyces sp.]